MSVEGQDERRTAEWVATSLEAMASKLSLPHGPEFLERAVDDLLTRATDVRAFDAALVESEARERELEKERDDARTAGRLMARALVDRVAVLVEALKEIVVLHSPERGNVTDSTLHIARSALAGVVEAEPDDPLPDLALAAYVRRASHLLGIVR